MATFTFWRLKDRSKRGTRDSKLHQIEGRTATGKAGDVPTNYTHFSVSVSGKDKDGRDVFAEIEMDREEANGHLESLAMCLGKTVQ